MRAFCTATAAFLALGLGCGHAPAVGRATDDALAVSPVGERAPFDGPETWFTGSARVTPLFDPRPSRHAGAASVSFAPGARTAWHSHPAGQTLVITDGTGWVQAWGGERVRVHAGDVVWTPPGVKHWHGATAGEGMRHIALQEAVDGRVVDWMEPVTDAQYAASGDADEPAAPERDHE
ncbi:MAG: cupin domain-containing protein [Myxococcales bacterium]|nr:cupin domain-containing protein [Myxococcales bacterium]MCB9734079.1 cupin domain-containing protein [Deltaproteobacteria bacterium]